MYLSEIKLWNFRKYGTKGERPEHQDPGLSLKLQQGLNVLIGENDSGKSAIIDAIRYALGTQSGEWIRIDETDFHGHGTSRATSFKIECVFRGFTNAEAGPFLEWLGFEEVNGTKGYVLKLRMSAQRKRDRIITDLRAGPDEIGTPVDGEARARLRVTYLKPLRDAENELTAGQRSRFAQILRAHPHFQKDVIDGAPKPHRLEEIIAEANKEIRDHFKPAQKQDTAEDASSLLRSINKYLESFFAHGETRSAEVKIAGSELVDILRRLELSLDENRAGLGSLNLVYMAAELLLLQGDEFTGLRFAIIEELEAHLHPQAQLRLVHFLRNEGGPGQYLLSTHSTTLGASVDLKKLVICRATEVFPMGPEFTKLTPKNYGFLQRFLDSTKANLFFARGVILVEGDSEHLLIPLIAEIIDRPLHRYGVSIVNVASTAFSHYEKIFLREDGASMGIKVAVVTDLDVKPLEWYTEDKDKPSEDQIVSQKKKQRKTRMQNYDDPNVRRFVSPNWTLEYEIALSKLRKTFYKSVLWAEKKQNSKTGEPLDSKKQEIQTKAKSDLALWESTWKNDERCAQKIAFEIYKKCMLEKRISKTITAQDFAARLQSERKPHLMRNPLRMSRSLDYLVEAICHVTEPLPRIAKDEDSRQ